MDPAVEDRWKEAVMPVALGVIEGYEFTPQGRADARLRFQVLGLPEWAIPLREYLLERIAAAHLPYLPTFAIRFEVAVAGIGCLYPLPDERLAAYSRALKRFFHLALTPILARIEAVDEDTQRQEYEALQPIYQFYGSENGEQGPEHLTDFLGQLEKEIVSHQPRTLANFLAFWCIRLTHSGLCHPYAPLDDGLINRFMFQLGQEYQLCYGDDSLHTDRIAQALVAGLETQCPEPEWMPRDGNFNSTAAL
ncbi:MAG: hypothetical protein QM758_05985 [Armatimonas sp.]